MSVEDVTGADCRYVHGLSVQDVAGQLEDGSAVLIDLRAPEEVRRAGRIPQALPLGLGNGTDIEPQQIRCNTESASAVKTIFCCADGARSAQMAAILLDLGHSKIDHLQGGIAAWQNEGRPITHLDPENL